MQGKATFFNDPIHPLLVVGLAVSVWLDGVLVYEERVGVAEDIPSLPRTTPPGPGMG